MQQAAYHPIETSVTLNLYHGKKIWLVRVRALRYITWRNYCSRIADATRESFSPFTCSCWFRNYFCLIAEGVDRLRMAGATGENTDSSAASPRQQTSRKPPKNRLSCQVTLLDGTVLNTDHLQVSVLNEFFAHIKFGLSYFFNMYSLKGLSCFNGCCNRSFSANLTVTNSALTMKLSSCSVDDSTA